VFPAGQKISPRAANKAAKDGLKTLLIPTEEIFGRYAANDLIDEKTGRIYIEAGDEVSPKTSKARQGRDRPARRCSTSTTSTPARGSATR
jgi:DNA-directed RNA polymerase subunit beta